MGLQDEAKSMLFKSKDKELIQEVKNLNLARILGLFIQRVVIGYGYRIEYSFYLSLLFFIIGWHLKTQEIKRAKKLVMNLIINDIKPKIILFLVTKTNYLNLALASMLLLPELKIGVRRSFLYTLDTLLPVMVLDETHKEITTLKSTQNYFYFLKLWGYLVVVLLVPLLFR